MKIDNSFYFWILFFVVFFLLDEMAFIIYNVSFFQFVCSNTLFLFLNDEIPILIDYYFDHVIYNTFFDNNNKEQMFSFNTIYEQLEYKLDVSDSKRVNINTLLQSNNAFNNIHSDYFKIKLESTNVKKHLISFYPLQKNVYTIPGEASLVFYRLENRSDIPIHTLSVYVTIPNEAVGYITKLQCFCYEELMIAPFSVVDLPILFSIDNSILIEEYKEITINYILLLKDALT